MSALRWVVRLCFAPGSTLPGPWHEIIPALVLFGGYMLFARLLFPYLVRVTAVTLSAAIRALTFLSLAPDLISTSIRRARGQQPAGWTFVLGDPIQRVEGSSIRFLDGLRPTRKQHTPVAIMVMIVLMALPIGAYSGVKNTTNPGLQNASVKYLDL